MRRCWGAGGEQIAVSCFLLLEHELPLDLGDGAAHVSSGRWLARVWPWQMVQHNSAQQLTRHRNGQASAAL